MDGWRVGVDIGGTFTDVVAVDTRARRMRRAKVRTRRCDELTSLRAAVAAVGLDPADATTLIHGTTTVTNAIVENRLPEAALIATEGFRDVIAIGRQNRRYLYRLDAPPKVECLVPDERRFEVRERMDADGGVLTPLDEPSVARVLEAVAASGVQTVAVSLLHAYANPAHELALEARLRNLVPHVSLSHRVNPEEREFERTNATVLNAAVMPLLADYVERLTSSVPTQTRLHFFHSAGGMASPAMVREHPLILAMSGPAAGVAAACQTAAALDLADVIAFDMGGTTTDVCLIRRGRPELRFDVALAGQHLRQLMVAVESIGAGGGSIARLDRGALKVGPESAGADPGPACYGRGGADPTVTDANVVLGYLDSRRPLGDGIEIDRALAEQAIGRLAAAAGLGLIETALGIVRIANASMVRAMRNVTVERGIDGRRCTLVAYGGAGPMHAAALAREFGIGTVIVPAASGIFSALGCVTAVPSFTRQRTLRMASDRWDAARLTSARADILREITADLGIGAASEVHVEDVALVRYAGQSYSVEIPYEAPADVERIARDFREAHARHYGFATDEPWEIEAIRVRVLAQEEGVRFDAFALEECAGTQLDDETSPCWFSPAEPTATLRRSRQALHAGVPLAGPAVVTDEWSTIVVPPGSMLVADASGNLTLTFGSEPG